MTNASAAWPAPSRRSRAASCCRRRAAAAERAGRRRAATPNRATRRTPATSPAHTPASAKAATRNIAHATRIERGRVTGRTPSRAGSGRAAPRRGSPRAAGNPVPPAHLVPRLVGDLAQAIAGHERIHVVQLVRVEVQRRARESHAGSRSDRVNRSCSMAGCGVTRRAVADSIGTCVCWLRMQHVFDDEGEQQSPAPTSAQRARPARATTAERDVERQHSDRAADRAGRGARGCTRTARAAAAGSRSCRADRRSRTAESSTSSRRYDRAFERARGAAPARRSSDRDPASRSTCDGGRERASRCANGISAKKPATWPSDGVARRGSRNSVPWPHSWSSTNHSDERQAEQELAGEPRPAGGPPTESQSPAAVIAADGRDETARRRDRWRRRWRSAAVAEEPGQSSACHRASTIAAAGLRSREETLNRLKHCEPLP